MTAKSEKRSEYWCVVANVKREIPFGEGHKETKVGTRQFKGGARVNIVGSFPGSCDGLVVIGQNRHSGKFIRSIIKVTVVENLRVKKLYGQSALKLRSCDIPTGAWMVESKADAEGLMHLIPKWRALW